jgi:5-formyltetrahydrofolate cyclo-ligase
MHTLMDKANLRKEYLRLRSQLGHEEWERRNRALFTLLFELPGWELVRTLHTYLPMASHHEPDTWRAIHTLRNRYPAVRIALPRINSFTGELEHGEFTSREALLPGQWGILEPSGQAVIAETEMDWILVPMLVGDNQGYRIGYGKGYYDKFLAKCRPDAMKVGISLFPLMEKIPHEAHDIPLDWVVTPEGNVKIALE